MKRNVVIIILIIIMLILNIFINAKLKKTKYLNNILIFNLYGNQKNNEYEFDISSNPNNLINANLYSTLNMESLAKDKIAPGTKGEFGITLKSSKDLNYNINFKSNNEKPQNLLFNIKGKPEKYSSLDELEKYLEGIIRQNSKIKVYIEWSWEYESNLYNDIQDTIDGENLREYNFDINITSYELY